MILFVLILILLVLLFGARFVLTGLISVGALLLILLGLAAIVIIAYFVFQTEAGRRVLGMFLVWTIIAVILAFAKPTWNALVQWDNRMQQKIKDWFKKLFS